MQTALITGGSKRIGKAIALALHPYYDIIIHYNSGKLEAEALQQELNTLRPHSASIMHAELGNSTQIQTICQNIKDVSLLVNNASVFYPTPIADVNTENFSTMMNVNVLAPLLLSKELAPLLAKNNGSIVNIVDIHSVRPLKNYSIYNISKAAIAMLTQTLAKELAPDVRVNGVSPGSILWPENAAEIDATTKEKMLENIVLKRQGSPENIAQTVLFLAQNDYITGQIINVDGGRTLNQ